MKARWSKRTMGKCQMDVNKEDDDNDKERGGR
jgi:hypothetical protein